MIMHFKMVKLLIACFVTATLTSSINYCIAQPAPPQYLLLALSKTDHILAIIDPVSLKVTARIPVGPDPHEVIASADGKTAYVSNTGSGKFHEINIIDLAGQKALP